MKQPALFFLSLRGEYLLHCYVTNVPGSRTKVVEAIRRGKYHMWMCEDPCVCEFEIGGNRTCARSLRCLFRSMRSYVAQMEAGGNPASLASLLYLGPDNRQCDKPCVNSGSCPETITITGSTMLPLLQLSKVDV